MKKVEKKHGKNYTEDELMYLESSWGVVSVKKIASTLGRSVEAIEAKARKLNLGNPLHCKDFLIAVELEEILGVSRKTLQKHFQQRGLKHKIRTLKNRKLITVLYDDLVSWLIENPQYWDATKVDRLALISLGLDEKIIDRKYKEDKIKEERTTLTQKDIEKIKKMYKQFITYEGIALALNKEYSTIKWKIHMLSIAGELEASAYKDRLVRVVNRENYGWLEWQDKMLIKEFRNGKSLREISVMVGKSLSATKSRNQTLSKRMMQGLAV